ncbi:hypothetical protein HYT52_00535 [Candidatus Woesearchaeota archaeon]|nr:hypothetical protein [Candidatus Woesearchaeota archaeon]
MLKKDWSLPYKEVSDKALAKMSDSEKILELRRAFNFLRKNYVPPKKEDLDEDGCFFKALRPPFNKGTIERLEWNHYVYVYFTDIVQRLIIKDSELKDVRKTKRL